MTSPAEQITRSAVATELDAEQVRDLACRVEAVDGAPPLDEQAYLRLVHPVAGVTHVFVRAVVAGAPDQLIGYAQIGAAQIDAAQVDGGQVGDGARIDRTPVTAEILVGPDGGRDELAAALFDEVELSDQVESPAQVEPIDQAEDSARPEGVLVWARGDASPVRAEAQRRHYVAARTLLTMVRPLTDADTDTDTDDPPPPDGATIRAFRPGQDDAAWLGVNSRAFAGHPEQGRWTQTDLDDRIAQPWFDPAGFLLAVAPDGDLLGFHWTKRHSPELGEVYVIGMDPTAQGRGLGKTLLRAGLDYLRGTGASTVILYTDEENHGAVRLYERSGFTVSRRQTQYQRRNGPSAP